MNRNVVIGGAIVLVVIALIAGALVGPKIPFVAGLSGASVGQFVGGPGGANGPMAQLTEEERAQLQGMSDEERQAFFREKMGDQAPGAGASGRPGGGRGAILVEGEVMSVAADSVTLKTSDGGSQTIYLDDTTAIGYAKGAEQSDLAEGDDVILMASPEADNVITATAVVVK